MKYNEVDIKQNKKLYKMKKSWMRHYRWKGIIVVIDYSHTSRPQITCSKEINLSKLTKYDQDLQRFRNTIHDALSLNSETFNQLLTLTLQHDDMSKWLRWPLFTSLTLCHLLFQQDMALNSVSFRPGIQSSKFNGGFKYALPSWMGL